MQVVITDLKVEIFAISFMIIQRLLNISLQDD